MAAAASSCARYDRWLSSGGAATEKSALSGSLWIPAVPLDVPLDVGAGVGGSGVSGCGVGGRGVGGTGVGIGASGLVVLLYRVGQRSQDCPRHDARHVQEHPVRSFPVTPFAWPLQSSAFVQDR